MSEQTRTQWTLADLRIHRDEIIALAQEHGAFDVRVFGSVARDEALPKSDIDFLVTFREGSTIFDQVGLWLDLQDFLNCEIDLLADHPEGGEVTKTALAQAVAL
jgi:predicted nucleotidyltransferase